MTPRSIDSVLGIIAAGVALLVAISMPAAAYLSGKQALQSELGAEARFLGHAITDFINSSPQEWAIHEHRISIVLTRSQAPDTPPRRVELRGENGDVIASIKPDLARPVSTVSVLVYDYGKPVGHVTVSGSLRPTLISTGVMGLLGVLLAATIYFPLRLIPMRALRRSQQDLKHANNILEERVVERTLALGSSVQQLAQSEQRLRALLDGIPDRAWLNRR